MNESPILKDVVNILNRLPDVRIFRNNTGMAYQGNMVSIGDDRFLAHPRPITFGLMEGSADLIGWRSLVVTPAMVGGRVAVFASIETKRNDGRGRRATEQKTWAQQVQRFGGFSGFAESVGDALSIIGADYM